MGGWWVCCAVLLAPLTRRLSCGSFRPAASFSSKHGLCLMSSSSFFRHCCSATLHHPPSSPAAVPFFCRKLPPEQVLKNMRRGYSVESYMKIIDRIKEVSFFFFLGCVRVVVVVRCPDFSCLTWQEPICCRVRAGSFVSICFDISIV